MSDGTAGREIEASKRRMRHQAVAERRGVGEAERTTAGERLATVMAQAVRVVDDGTTSAFQTKTDVQIPAATPRGDKGLAIGHTDTDHEYANGGRTDGVQTGKEHMADKRTDTSPSEPRTIALRRGDTVAGYVSMGTEAPTLALLDGLLARGLRVLVPRLGRGRDIGFGAYQGSDALRAMPRSARGGLRPAEPASETLGPEALATARLVLIPAFAIDLDGSRLGRGGGWYDRALGHCSPATLKVGVCWDWEFVGRHAAVPHLPHDIAVDAVLTSERMVRLRS